MKKGYIVTGYTSRTGKVYDILELYAKKEAAEQRVHDLEKETGARDTFYMDTVAGYKKRIERTSYGTAKNRLRELLAQ